MITETHECCGVRYGFENHAFPGETALRPDIRKAYFKLISANNKNTPNWVGVSEAEFNLSKKGFEREG